VHDSFETLQDGSVVVVVELGGAVVVVVEVGGTVVVVVVEPQSVPLPMGT